MKCKTLLQISKQNKVTENFTFITHGNNNFYGKPGDHYHFFPARGGGGDGHLNRKMCLVEVSSLLYQLTVTVGRKPGN